MKKINNKLLLVNYKRNLQIGVSFWMVQGAGTCFFLLVMTILEGDWQDCVLGCVGEREG